MYMSGRAAHGFNFFFSEFHPHAMYGEIKIYGNDGSIIQFSVFMAHFGRLLPHSTALLVCRMQTLTQALKNLFNFTVFMFSILGAINDGNETLTMEITEWRKITEKDFPRCFSLRLVIDQWLLKVFTFM